MSFFVEDIVTLKTNTRLIGEVDRTHGDVTSHHPIDEQMTGIKKSKRIGKKDFKDFLQTGVPPRNTVLVTWLCFPGRESKGCQLVTENELSLSDRCLITGDIVKEKVEDSMSGTVIQTQTLATLVRPRPWSLVSRQSPTEDVTKFGNYTTQEELYLRDIPTSELVPANRYNVDDFVQYHDWIGRVVNNWEDFYIRLSNNTVVVPEEFDELEFSALGDAFGDEPAVGHFVSTKKSYLRRGRWIYGAYDASVEPQGYVADIRTIRLDVEWLYPKDSYRNEGQPVVRPPPEVDQEMLESRAFGIYDRCEMPLHPLPDTRRLELEVVIGDAVRFKDLTGAALKYGNDSSTHGPRLERITRMETLGYDINVFKIARTYTMVTVLWQDLTTTTVPSIELQPYLDLAQDDEVWPGELIATRLSSTNPDGEREPDKVGVVQRVNAQDRMAQVRWFPSASICLLQDGDSPILLPGAFTGPAADHIEEVSMYEIDQVPGLERRLGDFVIIHLCTGYKDKGIDSSIYDRVERMVESIYPNDWFGEVVELCLDGLLKVRLGMSNQHVSSAQRYTAESSAGVVFSRGFPARHGEVRDVCVPWECTYLVHSSDMDDDDDDSDDDMDVDDTSEDTDTTTETDSDMPELVEVQVDGQWRDIAEVDNNQDMEEWTTDEEDAESVSAIVGSGPDSDRNASDGEHDDKNGDFGQEEHGVPNEKPDDDMADDDNDPTIQDSVLLPSANGSSSSTKTETTFSYSTIFENPTSESYKFEKFLVLDTLPASDHHFLDRNPIQNSSRSKRIQREYKGLKNSLPDGVFVRTWESRLDLLRILILGPLDTPYEYAPFVFDMWLTRTYPTEPPEVFFHSWTGGMGAINPNLYEDGKVCLSLLGTWPGAVSESWRPDHSTVLQILVSLLGLVFVKDPFFNEAGYEARVGTAESRIPSTVYNERTYFNSRGFIAHALQNSVQGFDDELKHLYRRSETRAQQPGLLIRAIRTALEVIVRSNRARESPSASRPETGLYLSAGALIALRKKLTAMAGLLEGQDSDDMKQIIMANDS